MAAEKTGARALPEAIDTMQRASDRLDKVATELKKRPLIRDAVFAVSAELEEAAAEAWPYGAEHADDLAGMERLAREEVAAVALLHVCRLPGRSGWRPTLIGISEIDHEFSVERSDQRLKALGEEKAIDVGAGAPEDIVALAQLLRAISDHMGDEESDWGSFLNRFADKLDRSGLDAMTITQDTEIAGCRHIEFMARRYASMLPDESPWKKLFTDLAEGLQQDGTNLMMTGAAPTTEVPTPTPEQEVTLAEIVTKRDAISRMWDHYETVEKAEDDKGKAEKARLWEEAQRAELDLSGQVLDLIAKGKLPARAAAEAALGRHEIQVDAVEVARREGADV